MTANRPATLAAAALLSLGAAMAAAAAPLPSSPLPASRAAQIQAQAAALRQTWLAAGHAVPVAGTAPFIASGAILTPQVTVNQAPATVGVSVSYRAANGLSMIMLQFSSATTTQSFGITYSGYGSLEPSTQGSVTLQQPAQSGDAATFPLSASTSLSLYAAPGTWNLVSVSIFDQAGQYNSYTGTQIAGIFKQTSFQAINTASPDTTPPTASAGLILTPVVSLSAATPLFRAGFTVADPLSGVASASLVFAAVSGSGIGGASSRGLTAPINAGQIVVSAGLNSAVQSPGTYQITAYQLCDFAGNCATDTSPTDIQALFQTTTFRVVK